MKQLNIPGLPESRKTTLDLYNELRNKNMLNDLTLEKLTLFYERLMTEGESIRVKNKRTSCALFTIAAKEIASRIILWSGNLSDGELIYKAASNAVKTIEDQRNVPIFYNTLLDRSNTIFKLHKKYVDPHTPVKGDIKNLKEIAHNSVVGYCIANTCLGLSGDVIQRTNSFVSMGDHAKVHLHATGKSDLPEDLHKFNLMREADTPRDGHLIDIFCDKYLIVRCDLYVFDAEILYADGDLTGAIKSAKASYEIVNPGLSNQKIKRKQRLYVFNSSIRSGMLLSSYVPHQEEKQYWLSNALQSYKEAFEFCENPAKNSLEDAIAIEFKEKNKLLYEKLTSCTTNYTADGHVALLNLYGIKTKQ